MSALEVGTNQRRGARSSGVGQAAFETAIRYSQTADRLRQAHLPASGGATDARRHGHEDRGGASCWSQNAARKKDAGERCDVEAGMAKLFASEACAKISLDAIARPRRFTASWPTFPIERFYRDAPLMMIGEGTNEIQALGNRPRPAYALSDLANHSVASSCSASAHSTGWRKHHLMPALHELECRILEPAGKVRMPIRRGPATGAWSSSHTI